MFSSFLFEEYKNTIVKIINRMQMAAFDLNRHALNLNKKGILEKLVNAEDEISQINTYTEEHIKAVNEIFTKTLAITETILEEAIKSGLSEPKMERIYNYLDIDSRKGSPIEYFRDSYSRYIDSLTAKLRKDIKDRPKDIFFKAVREQFSLNDDIPQSIQLQEDGVDILEDTHVSTLFNLRNALYIDTPMAIGTDHSDNLFWNAMLNIMLESPGNRDWSAGEKKLKLRIKELLDGETIVEKDGMFNRKELRFVSNDQKVNIPLKDTATGFKTFAYLQRLLENGLLCDKSILMIDEPEAHLHPQWIVEYARLLVLLNKELGLKIMIASHNPDMVTAIHDIAAKEGVLDGTNFYAARQDNTNTHQYIFKNLGHGIEEIFESFNIALDNICRYGRVDL